MSRTSHRPDGRPYGLARVCRVWGVAAPPSTAIQPPPGRPAAAGPGRPMANADLVEAIRAVLAASPFHGEGHRKVWARLRDGGIRTSRRRVLRLMRENDLLAPSRAGAPRGPRNHDGTIIPEAVDTMWGTDQIATVTGESRRPCSAPSTLLGRVRRHPRQRPRQPLRGLEPIRQGVRRHFGGFAKDVGRGLAIRHDHGSAIHVRRLPAGAGLPGHRKLAGLRAGRRRATAAPSASSAR